MQFNQDSSVFTADGDEVGRIDRVVIDPKSQRVTHIVVRKGFLFTEDKVVPIGLVASADEDQVRLREDIPNLEALPDFEEQTYIPVEAGPGNMTYSWGYVPPFYWYPPLGGMPPAGDPGYAVPPYTVETERNVPDDTVSLKEGAEVISADGKNVGSVARVLADSKTDRVTHFLVSEGVFFKEKRLIPASWVSEIVENEVRLAVDADVLARVPEYHE